VLLIALPFYVTKLLVIQRGKGALVFLFVIYVIVLISFFCHRFAYIEFKEAESCQNAMLLNETEFKGRALKVIYIYRLVIHYYTHLFRFVDLIKANECSRYAKRSGTSKSLHPAHSSIPFWCVIIHIDE
jgi:hypothetical protein